MVRERLKNIEIVYNRRYLKEKNIIKKNIEKINIILYELWRLGSCEEIKIYILNSNIKFLICIYPFLQKLIFFLLFPIVYFKNRDVFKRSGCIYIDSNTSRILIKSCKYLSSIKANIGSLIFLESKDIEERYIKTFIGLFTSIFLHNLKLNKWLSSGVISITNEIFLGKRIIKIDSIKILIDGNHNKGYLTKSSNDNEEVYYHVKGYWTVRYLEENYPGFLKEIFKEYKGEEIVEQIRLKLGLNHESFWEKLDELLYESYKHLLQN